MDMALPTNMAKGLCKAVELGFKRMETARKARYRFLAQYVGPFYSKAKMGGENEERKASPISLMYNGITTLVPNLVYNEPRSKITTELLPYRGYASTFELAENHLIRRIKLKDTLRKTITDGIIGAGFIKTGIAVSGQTLNLDGKVHDIGEPFADRVDMDDMVIDPMARDWNEMEFVGNRFRISKQSLLESGIYPADKIEKLPSRYDGGDYKNEAANLSGDGRIAIQFNGEVTEYVDLVEVYLPKQQLIVTIPATNGSYGGGQADIIRVVDYEGPDHGPFHMLGFAWVPDNVLPVPPASVWYYLHVLGNRIARKIARQAERMKSVMVYEPAAVEDAQQVKDADDGETIAVEDVNKVKEMNYGGTSKDAYDYLNWVQAEFSKIAGNLDLISGSAANQPTATQSEILNTNGQVRLTDMQNIVYSFTGEVMTDLGFYLHTDPLIDLMLTKRVNGMDQQVRYTPEMREGNFFDYMIAVKPYSMARQDPNVQLKRIMDFVSTGIPAIAQAFQLLGPGLNIEGVINLVLDKMGIEERDEIVNSPLLQQRIQQLMLAVPPDGKAAQPVPGTMPPPLPGGGRPEQPNPGQMGPTGGAPNPQAVQQQQTAGELQATYLH